MSGTRDRIVQSAEKHLSRGRLDQALKDYLRLLAENPNDAFALNKAGDLCVRMRRNVEAIDYFARIAELYSGDGFFLKAIAILRKINKIDPTRLDIHERLAELYAKQGLTQEARSHYQTVAEQLLQKSKVEEAIVAYAKMAALDPADLRIQARLADLHRVANQIGEAVARYDAIGSLLQRRGAHEEAVTVFRKALELDPADSSARREIVRCHLSMDDPGSAIASLEGAPRTAEFWTLLAEAHLARGDRSSAASAAEDAVAVDPAHEGALFILGRIRLEQGAPDRAVETLSPLVDLAVGSGDFARAASYLRPVLEAHPRHPGVLEKMADIREAEGDAGESVAMRMALGREAEARADLAAAAAHYRRVLLAQPSHAEASARMAVIAPREEPAGEGAPSGTDTVRSVEAVAALEEAEVFARYGLKDRAVEKLRALSRRQPDLLSARERLVELMVELQNPAAPREAEALAQAYRVQGKGALGNALLERLGLTPRVAARPASVPPPAGGPEFEEFEIEMPAPAPRGPLPEAPAFDPFAILGSASAAAPGSQSAPREVRLTPLPQALPAESEFGFSQELGSLIEEKMLRASREPRRAAAPSAGAVDEENLFADEQQFFNLAEELERELKEESVPPQAPPLAAAEGEASLEEIFREFRKGVEQQLSAEDYETHYNLGIAYKEMGLLDEAIGEFQLASKAPALTVECCSLLGLCFIEKGMPQLAIKWYGKGLASPGIRESETAGLLYDLARVYQETGDVNLAYKTFLEVYGMNTNYRDVVDRVRDLEEARKNTRESFH